MKNYIITENQFKYLVENIIKEDIEMEKRRKETIKQYKKEKKWEGWFLNLLNQLEKKQNIDYSYYIDWVDKNTNEVYVRYVKDIKDLYLDYRTIWLKLKNNYSEDSEKIKELIRFVMEQHLDILDINLIGGMVLK